MKTLVKIVLKIVLFAVALVVLALLTLPLWFGPVARAIANNGVPPVIKTDFRLDRLSLNPYLARFELHGLTLANPPGYPVPTAVKLDELVFDAETATLLTDVIHIEEIRVRGLYVSLVSGGENKVMNFTQIQYNLAGGKAKYEADKAKKAAAADAAKPASEARQPAGPAAEAKKPSKKVIIDRLVIADLRLGFGFLEVPLPSLTLTDIGRKTGGATFEEAWDQVSSAVMKSAGAIGDQFKALQKFSGKHSKKAMQLLDSATKAAGAWSGNAVSGAGDAAGNGAKAVGDGAKAVGDGAKKALESLKGLW